MLLSGHMKAHEIERIIQIMRSSDNASADLTPYSENTWPHTASPTPHSPELGIAAETCRRLSCDTGLVRISHAPEGSILDVGRRTRTISPALRRALEARDRGCRFPGCGLRFCDAHHVTHWADGGETSLSNTLLACRHHHRLVHEGGWTVDWWGVGRPVFFDPRGGTHFEGRWRPPEEMKNVSAETLIQRNRDCGVRPDGWTAGARWEREADIPDRIYFRAMEALGEGGGPGKETVSAGNEDGCLAPAFPDH